MPDGLASPLWPASFKGLPFYVEQDKDVFGKRLVVNEFPGRDDPFNEDLGAKARTFEVTAYLVGDGADVSADALVAAMLAAGPGTLVLPAQGPIQARAHQGQRDRQRDKLGYFAFSLSFVVEGAGPAVASVDYLGQLVYDAVDSIVGAASSLLAQVSLS